MKFPLFTILFCFSCILSAQNLSFDTSFGDLGGTSFGLSNNAPHSPSDIKIQGDKKILAAGDMSFGFGFNYQPLIVRLFPDGSLDTTFMVNGMNAYQNTEWSTHVYEIEAMNDGKILVTGDVSTTFGTMSKAFLSRLLPNGSLDSTFGNNGNIELEIPSNEIIGQRIAITDDGKILMAGMSSAPTYLFLAKYLEDGHLDSSFATNGIVKADLSSWDEGVTGLEILENGKILISGFYDHNPSINVLLRGLFVQQYNENGQLDTNFGNTNEGFLFPDYYISTH